MVLVWPVAGDRRPRGGRQGPYQATYTVEWSYLYTYREDSWGLNLNIGGLSLVSVGMELLTFQLFVLVLSWTFMVLAGFFGFKD